MCEHFPGLSVEIKQEFEDEFWPLVVQRSADVNICFVALIENLSKRMTEMLNTPHGEDEEAKKLVNLNVVMLVKYLYPIMDQLYESATRHVRFDLFDQPPKEKGLHE